ncbi:hypothetical protein GF402_00230 [Candidatus Fermentibacteria bacterium]|nr:hypothetical protein [Candidatus Fermentibacteria bacterium]
MQKEGLSAKARRRRIRGYALDLLRNRYPSASAPAVVWLPDRPPWGTELSDVEVLRKELLGVRLRGGKIVLYGHDDMDGITGLFVGLRVLRGEGFHVIPIVPRRESEDYGLQPERMEPHLREGDLLMTVDYGCTAVRGVDWARKRGARVVVTDHHTLNDPLPAVHGMVNPQKNDSEGTVLAGCGVLYCALTAVYPRWEDDDQLLAAVALGTVSDRVPLIGWNRYLLHRWSLIRRDNLTAGLKVLMDSWPGEGNAWSASMVRHDITSTVGKGSGSGIDRMLNFMFSNDEDSCRRSWAEMSKRSMNRGGVLSKIVRRAMELKDPQADAYGMVLVKMDEMPSGMGGTLASKLCKICRRGAIVVARRSDGTFTGEARSMGDWDMARFLVSLKDRLTSAGGHAMAAGFSKNGGEWPELRDLLISHMAEFPARPVPRPHIDLTLRELPDPRHFLCLAPFGPRFPPPALRIDGMRYLLNLTGKPNWCISEDIGE